MELSKLKIVKEICLCAFVSTQLFTEYHYFSNDEKFGFPCVVFHLKDKCYLGETDLIHIKNLSESLNALTYCIDFDNKLVNFILHEN